MIDMNNPTYRTARIHYTSVPMWAQRFVFDRDNGVFSIGSRDKRTGNHTCFVPHRHNEIEMLHIVKGSMTIEDSRRVYDAREGEIYIFNSGEPHYGFIGPETRYVEYCFFTADLSRLAPPSGNELIGTLFGNGSKRALFTGPVSDEELGSMIDLLPAFNDRLTSDESAGLAMIGILYSVLARLISFGCVNICEKTGTRSFAFVTRMNDFISENYTSEITSDMLRRHFPYAPSYFCRLFKQNYGRSFFCYLEYYRVQRAKELLLSSDKFSVSEIAASVGFSEGQQLSRSFKRVEGISPSEFVRKSRRDEAWMSLT